VGLGLRQVSLGTTASTQHTLSFWARSISGNSTIEFSLMAGTTVTVDISPAATLKLYSVQITSGVGSAELDISVTGTVGVFDLWGFNLASGGVTVPYTRTGVNQLLIPNPGTVVNGDSTFRGNSETHTLRDTH